MTKEGFLAAAIPAARTISARSGLPAGITVAQAALESAWGDSRLALDAHNYFGIKARPGRETIALPTHEFAAGEQVATVARFTRYPSLLECFRDRDEMILTLSVYADARAAAADPVAFIRALAKHWATDPRYADKVLDLYHGYRFDLIDQKK